MMMCASLLVVLVRTSLIKVSSLKGRKVRRGWLFFNYWFLHLSKMVLCVILGASSVFTGNALY